MQTKQWWKSKTLHGNLVTVVGIVLSIAGYGAIVPEPVIDTAIGFILSGVGVAWSTYGRVKANSELVRK